MEYSTKKSQVLQAFFKWSEIALQFWLSVAEMRRMCFSYEFKNVANCDKFILLI